MRLLRLNVYRATPAGVADGGGESSPTPGLKLIELTGPTVADLLGAAPQAELFPVWLAAGYRGLVLERDGAWLSFGWLATPSSPSAVHVPTSLGAGRFWIFNCHTRFEHRGQGHYQRLLVGLVELATRLGAGAEDEVFIDTVSANRPSIRAIERVGFRPAGRILQLDVSRLGMRLSLPIGVPRGRSALPR